MSLKLMLPPKLPTDPKTYLEQYKAGATKALQTGASTNGMPVHVDQWIARIDQFAAITEKNHLNACSVPAQEHAAALYASIDKIAFAFGMIRMGAMAAMEHQHSVVGAAPSSSAEAARLARLQAAISNAGRWHFMFVNQQRMAPWQSIH